MNLDKTILNPQPRVLVIGGFGFIGRHVVRHLKRAGAKVLVGTRGLREKTKSSENTCAIALHKMRNERDWDDVLSDIDVVVNAVGILRQRFGESYEQVHHHAVFALAKACEKKQIRFVHVSILGVNSPANSRFVTSKLRGEEAIKKTHADWHIVRPSLIDGEGGFGAKWFRRVAKWPVHFAPANATGAFAPLDADDLGEAISKIALALTKIKHINDRIYELGGSRKVKLFEYFDLLNPGKKSSMRVTVPAWIARVVSHVCDLLYVTPFSYGHYQLLNYRNYPERNRIEELLGRPAARITNSKVDTAPLEPVAKSIHTARTI